MSVKHLRETVTEGTYLEVRLGGRQKVVLVRMHALHADIVLRHLGRQFRVRRPPINTREAGTMTHRHSCLQHVGSARVL